ncbi:MAG: hypothetical protein ABGX83_02395 [Nitrospira sp.]|nr:hypothetical protein [Candidatus Manganitrophaceae bacterium]HIL35242.1 hypothetical protein [Candidatus Manganitrophaceae bacterium]
MIRKILTSFTLPFFLFIIFSPIVEAKPRPPLRLTFRHQGLSDGEIQLTLKAKANVASGRVTLSIDLPPGASVLEGETTWEGSLEKGEIRTIEVTILDPGSLLQEIRGKASLQFSAGGTFFQESKLKGSKKGAPEFREPIIRKEGGETILEFRGK